MDYKEAYLHLSQSLCELIDFLDTTSTQNKKLSLEAISTCLKIYQQEVQELYLQEIAINKTPEA